MSVHSGVGRDVLADQVASHVFDRARLQQSCHLLQHLFSPAVSVATTLATRENPPYFSHTRKFAAMAELVSPALLAVLLARLSAACSPIVVVKQASVRT